jgi:hypothetical protein
MLSSSSSLANRLTGKAAAGVHVDNLPRDLRLFPPMRENLFAFSPRGDENVPFGAT